MSDLKPLDLDRLLTCDVDELTAGVRLMSDRDCERYVQAILDRVGGPSFDQYIGRLVSAMTPSDGSGPPTDIKTYYFAVRDMFPNVPTESDILGRLAVFALRMCQLRFADRRKPTRH